MPVDNPNELFYHVNNKDQAIGSIYRRQAHDGSKPIHRAVVVVIFSPDYQSVLLQQRNLKKDTCPGSWGEAVGGHVTYGQTYRQAALRETEEELGFRDLKIKYFSKFLADLIIEREYYAIYTATLSLNVPVHFDTDEIQQVRWVKVTDMTDFIHLEPCTPGLIQSWHKIQIRFPV